MGNNPVSGVDPDGGFVDMNHRNYDAYKYEANWNNYYTKQNEKYIHDKIYKTTEQKRKELDAWFEEELKSLNHLGKNDNLTPEQLKTELTKLYEQYGTQLGALSSEGWASDQPQRNEIFHADYGGAELGYDGWKEKQWLEGRTYEFQQSRRIHELATVGGYETSNGKTIKYNEKGELVSGEWWVFKKQMGSERSKDDPITTVFFKTDKGKIYIDAYRGYLAMQPQFRGPAYEKAFFAMRMHYTTTESLKNANWISMYQEDGGKWEFDTDSPPFYTSQAFTDQFFIKGNTIRFEDTPSDVSNQNRSIRFTTMLYQNNKILFTVYWGYDYNASDKSFKNVPIDIFYYK